MTTVFQPPGGQGAQRFVEQAKAQGEGITALCVAQVGGVIAVGGGNNFDGLTTLTSQVHLAILNIYLFRRGAALADGEVKVFDSIKSRITAEHVILHGEVQLPIFFQGTHDAGHVPHDWVAGRSATDDAGGIDIGFDKGLPDALE